MQYRNTIWTWRNLALLPVVLFVRIPVLGPLSLLAWIGGIAERAGEFIGDLIPGLETKLVPVPLKPGEIEPRLLTKAEVEAGRAALRGEGVGK